MKKRINLLLLTLTTAICFLMSILLAFGGNVAIADSTFSIKNGFQIRMVAPEGIRVVVEVPNKIEDATYGTLMVPASWIDETHKLEFDETTKELDANILNIETLQFNSDGASYNSVLAAAAVEGEDQLFPESFYNTPITVRGYCIDGEGNITYTTNTVTRSMAYVVASYYVNGYEPVDNVETVIDRVIANGISNEITVDQIVVGTPVNAKFLVGGIDASASSAVTLAFSGDNDEVATVAADGTITPIKGGTLNLTATLSGLGGNVVTATKSVTVYQDIIDVANVYDFGVKNQTELVLSSDDITSAPQSVLLDGEAVDVDGYAVDLTSVTEEGSKTLTVLTENYTLATVKVNAVTANITSVEDFKKIASEWGSTGTYVLNADLDFKGETYSNTSHLAGFNFDGKGHTISNVQTSRLFGSTFFSGKIKNVALLGLQIAGNYQAGFVNIVSGGTLENIYVQGKTTTAVARSSMLAAEYNNSGTITNVIVDYDTTSVSGSGNAFSLITKINNAWDSDASLTPNLDMDIPKGINNVFSIGCPSKHIVIDTNTSSNTTYTLLSKATGGYADAAAFLADKDTIFADGASITTAFTLEKDAANNTVLKFFDRTVKSFCDGDISYTFGYKNQDLTIPVADFAETVSKIEVVGGAELPFTIVEDNYVVAGSNFTAAGVISVKITTASNVYYRNVEVITAVIMNAADLDNMDTWGRPSNYVDGTLGTQGYLYQYSGTFLLGADIDYGGASYSSDCYVGANGYVSGAGAYWNGLSFDGQGYKIDNIKFSNSFASLFGQWLSNSTVKNLAMTNVVIEGTTATNTNSAAICSVLKGNSVLENIYVSGDVQNNGAALSDISFVAISKTSTDIIKNVVVDFKNSSGIGKIAGIVNVGSTDSLDAIVNVENCYTIGSKKNICWTVPNGTVIDGVTYNYAWKEVTGSTGGYETAADFLTAYNASNAMLDANVFNVTTEEGATVLQFYNSALGQFRTVLTLAESAN